MRSKNVKKQILHNMPSSSIFSKLFKFVLKQREQLKTIAEHETILTKTIPVATSLAIYESELQAIGLESSSWENETGGDLFGIWKDTPIIYLATKAGPEAIRNNAHFRLDVAYLIKISTELNNEWGLRYFGDWHSHHKLGLHSPSSGDRNRIKRLAEKNNFNEMAELITSFMNDSRKDRIVQIHPFVYKDFPAANPIDSHLIVLKGLSPIREVLIKRKLMPEQHLESYSLFHIDNVKMPEELLGRVIGNDGNPQKLISERLILNAGIELKRVASKEIEMHPTSFGSILVVPVNDKQHVAFAVSKHWPFKILQVDWLDRTIGESTEIDLKEKELSLLDIDAIINCYKLIRENKK